MQETRAIVYKPRWFQNQKLIFGTVGTVLLWMLLANQVGLPGALSLVLAAQIVLFIFFFHRPVWAMAALIVGQLTANSFMISIGGTLVSVRLLWTVLAFLLLVPILRTKGGIKLGSQARRVIIPAMVFFGLATLANAVNVDMSYTMQYLRTGLSSVAIIFFMPAVIRNEKDLKLLCLVVLVTCLISALVAIMQHYSFMGLPSYTLFSNTIRNGRTIGLTEGPVHLAYDLSVILLPMVALFFLKGVGTRTRKYLPVMVLVIIAALFFTYTRSGLYSLAPGLLAMVLLMKGKIKREMFLVVVILIVGFFVYTEMSGNRYSKGFSEERSAAGRLVLWEAGARIALDYPLLGIGQGRFEEISLGYKADIKEGSVPGVVGVLGSEQPHNDFLRVWLSFGTPALFAYLWIYINIFRNFHYGYRKSSKRFVKGLSLGCFAALIAYIVNAATHNLMDTVPLLWILAGFSVALVKLAGVPKPVAVEKKVS